MTGPFWTCMGLGGSSRGLASRFGWSGTWCRRRRALFPFLEARGGREHQINENVAGCFAGIPWRPPEGDERELLE